MRVGVLGAGESGVGAAILAKKLEHEVFVSDGGQIGDQYRTELLAYAVPFEERGHTIERLKHLDCIVKSPGIPETADVIRSLRATGIEIISELEYAFRHCPGKIIAITGSNGKTTTATLMHHVMQAAGIDSVLCGNVGTGFARSVADDSHAWYVVEVSSFQLDDVIRFKPDIAILLNITPDHLDRYNGDFTRYAMAKWRIAQQMNQQNLLVVSAVDPTIRSMIGQVQLDCRITQVNEDRSAEFEMPMTLSGRHNAMNVACVAAVADELEITDKMIQSALHGFAKPPHRMELISHHNGIDFINDSKATNTDSVYYALDAMTGPVIWIAGGQDKGNDYSTLLPVVRGRVRVLICLGIDNRNLIEAFSSEVDEIMETTNMFEAVKVAASNALPGDTILLSPACASFDLFENYKDRGEEFRRAVLSQTEEEE